MNAARKRLASYILRLSATPAQDVASGRFSLLHFENQNLEVCSVKAADAFFEALVAAASAEAERRVLERIKQQSTPNCPLTFTGAHEMLGSSDYECNATKDLPNVLTLQEVADHLRRSTDTVRRRIKSGKLKAYLEGPHGYRIRREWLLDYEASLTKGPMNKL